MNYAEGESQKQIWCIENVISASLFNWNTELICLTLPGALFPKKKNNHIRLHIKELVFVGALQYSAEDIADLTMDIIGWLPEYENMLDNAQVELKKNELICQLGMTFLQTVAEDISGKGLVCHIWESFEAENTAHLSIQHGNGITCEYKIDLLSDFQQKLIDIVAKI